LQPSLARMDHEVDQFKPIPQYPRQAAMDRWIVNAAPDTRMKEVFDFNLDGCPEPGQDVLAVYY